MPTGTPSDRGRRCAFRVPGGITIDARLDEEGWKRPPVGGFTQKDPVEGAQPTYPTDVWVLYDDEAMYVGAKLHDPSPDSIVDRIGRRNADIDGDWFYVGSDSYHDRRTGFFFACTRAGRSQTAPSSTIRGTTIPGTGSGRRRPQSSTAGGSRK